jgi:aldehyde dehydrogenase (NAD+)
MTYARAPEAVEYIRSGGKPLALYVFSKDRDHIRYVIRHTTAGGTVVNNVVLHFANENLPFGGVGESGVGSYHGHFGFKAFSHERAVLLQGPVALSKNFYPPYTERMMKMLRAVLRIAG